MSAWGTSWADAWGVSWGASSPAPAPATSHGGDDVPRRIHRGWSKAEWLKLKKEPDDALERELRAVYASLTAEEAPVSVLARVDSIVRPFAVEKPEALEVNWRALAQEYETTKRLFDLWREERELEDEEDILMLIQ